MSSPRLDRKRSQKRESDAEIPEVISSPLPQFARPPDPVDLPQTARITQMPPSYDISDNSISSGIIPATSEQLYQVNRFCNSIGHWLYIFQILSSHTDKPFPGHLNLKPPEEYPYSILMEYDSGNMWYLDIDAMEFFDMTNVLFEHPPKCEVYNLRDQKTEKKKSKTDDMVTVYSFKMRIKIPRTLLVAMYRIRDPSNDNYGLQAPGYFMAEFTDLVIDLKCGISEITQGNKKRYHSPVAEMNYEIGELKIIPHKFPFPLEGASLPCTENTVIRILADLEDKIVNFKPEMIHRLRAREATIMNKFKRTTEKATSMVDFINLYIARVYRDLEKSDRALLELVKMYRPDPSLSKIELEIIKILLFIMEDNPKIRNMVFRCVRKEDYWRILNPFTLEKPQEKELKTINKLNKIITADFDGQDYTIQERIKELVLRETRTTPTMEELLEDLVEAFADLRRLLNQL